MHFSLRTLLLALSLAGLFCAALLDIRLIWASLIFFITFLAILLEAVLALFGPADQRPARAGFAIGAGIFLAITVCPGHFRGFPSSPLAEWLNLELQGTRERLLTKPAGVRVDELGDLQVTTWRLVPCLFALLVGFTTAELARRAQHTARGGQSSARLRNMLLGLVFVGLFCAALFTVHRVWATLFLFAAFLAVLFAGIVGLFGPADRRPALGGFAIAAAVYLALAVYPGGFAFVGLISDRLNTELQNRREQLLMTAADSPPKFSTETRSLLSELYFHTRWAVDGAVALLLGSIAAAVASRASRQAQIEA